MELIILSLLAGVLTVLSPCVLPILPVVLAGSVAEKNKRAPLIIIGSLAVSVVAFTLLIKGSTVLLGIPNSVWLIVSGALVTFIGLTFAIPAIWEWLSIKLHLQEKAGRLSAKSNSTAGNSRNVLLGLSLGPVFTSCSPTYGLILATVLPTSIASGISNLIAYSLGLGAVLLAIAYGGQSVTKRLGWVTEPKGKFRRGLGIFLIIIGLLITTGLIKDVETWLIDRGLLGTTKLEQRLLDSRKDTENNMRAADIPGFLLRSFPDTDWSKSDLAISKALDGGPGKDGIPAINEPKFEPISNFKHPDSVQAIVLKDRTNVKVYPYNILTWHEIVNDTVDDKSVAITFCPLCGSAIVYDRTLPDGVTGFGVSGALVESNMVMYDRKSETLWQQSTGKALAGKHFGKALDLVKFQLLTIGEVRSKHPAAMIMSEDTGHRRDYARNPYSGYEESEDFIFSPSRQDQRYPSKTIFVAFRVNGTPVASPWLELKDGVVYETEINEQSITISKRNSELTITNAEGQEIPFYFEMWFSWAVQHQDEGIVFDPSQ
jgi:cytochrome c biogenesis protein CcdA